MLSNKLEALVSADDSVKSVNDTLRFGSLAAHAAAGESTFVVRKQPPIPDFEIALAALELSVLGRPDSLRLRRFSCPSLPAEPAEAADPTETADPPPLERDLRRSGVSSNCSSTSTRPAEPVFGI